VAGNPRVVVDFIANTKSLNDGFKSASAGTEGFGSRVKGLAKAGVVAAGAAGLAALTGTLKVGISEFADAAKVSAQTEAVLKSTGGAAGVTAKQVERLATSIMMKTGIDDEAVQSGENLLLTFRNIQNQAGRGNDIFTRATRIMTDMSVALGQDTKSSAIQLGKALNDPIRGITALRRVGVSFTDAQQKQIKSMQDSGNIMGAQKVILAELTKEFGGSAAAAGKTLPGQLNILKESFKNLAGEIVGALAPAFAAVTKFFVEHPGLAKTLTIAILGLAAAMVVLNAALAVSAAITAPYMLLILGIAAAVAGLIAVAILLAKNWDKVTAVLSAGFNAIKQAASAVFGWLKANWPLLLGILTGPIGLAVAMVIRHWSTITNATTAAWNAIRGATSAAWTWIKNTVSNVAGAVAGAVSNAWNTLRSVTVSVFTAIKNKVSDVVGDVKSALSSLASWVSGFAHGALNTAVNAAKAVFSKIVDGAKDALAGVKSALDGIVNFIDGIVGRIGAAASSVANAIKRPINAVISAWNGLAIPRVAINLPSVKVFGHKIGGGSFGFGPISFPDIPLLAAGGVVDQPTLALIGEAGREIVTPESLLREIVGQQSVQVRVFIGDTELTDMIRTEIIDSNTGIARTLLAGAA
jgi:phage-related protein